MGSGRDLEAQGTGNFRDGDWRNHRVGGEGNCGRLGRRRRRRVERRGRLGRQGRGSRRRFLRLFHSHAHGRLCRCRRRGRVFPDRSRPRRRRHGARSNRGRGAGRQRRVVRAGVEHEMCGARSAQRRRLTSSIHTRCSCGGRCGGGCERCSSTRQATQRGSGSVERWGRGCADRRHMRGRRRIRGQRRQGRQGRHRTLPAADRGAWFASHLCTAGSRGALEERSATGAQSSGAVSAQKRCAVSEEGQRSLCAFPAVLSQCPLVASLSRIVGSPAPSDLTAAVLHSRTRRRSRCAARGHTVPPRCARTRESCVSMRSHSLCSFVVCNTAHMQQQLCAFVR